MSPSEPSSSEPGGGLSFHFAASVPGNTSKLCKSAVLTCLDGGFLRMVERECRSSSFWSSMHVRFDRQFMLERTVFNKSERADSENNGLGV